ncbi:hypothetical protein ACIBI9_04120 [Nonomuraea sp. NPDC050451]|uniref:hypothetical protein n=1 Tax=Nonomuraea sp. NPDC050451 TaxID=3364364 RepID=UPI0037A0E10D
MTTDRAYEALDAVRRALPELDAALVPGTRRRWSQHDLTPEQRDRMDTLARAERVDRVANAARGIIALGDGRAPLDLGVLVTLDDITLSITELEAAACDRIGITPLAGASTVERIGRLVGLLDRIAAHDDLAEHVEAEAVRLSRSASRALGDAEPIHRLDARCPVCDARSLRAFPEREVVLCINSACQCDHEDCPCHRDRPIRHRWHFGEWPWLAQVLADDLEEAS